jgi:quinol monooxygenase YgiN
VVVVIEKWETLDSLKAHLAATHMLEFQERTDQFVQGITLSILENAA